MRKENAKGTLETALARLHRIGATSIIILKLDAIKKSCGRKAFVAMGLGAIGHEE